MNLSLIINALPEDLLKYIFGMLCGKDRADICMVSKLWNTMSCITTLAIIPNIRRISKRDAYRDYHLFVMFKPEMNMVHNNVYVCKMGNLELFNQIFVSQLTPQDLSPTLWYTSAGKSGCVDILDALVDTHREIHSVEDILLKKAASAAGNYNNLKFVYKCIEYIKSFNHRINSILKYIYRESCKKCSVDTLCA